MSKINRSTDLSMGIAIILILVTFWATIICGIVGDTNIVAPYSTFTYMICTAIIMYKSIGVEVKGYLWRIMVGTILLWAILIGLYLIILAIKGIL